MVRVTTIKINTTYIKLFFLLMLFFLTLIMLKSAILPGYSGSSVVNKISSETFKGVIGNTMAIGKYNLADFDTSSLSMAADEVTEFLIGFSIKKPETVFQSEVSIAANYNPDTVSFVELPDNNYDLEDETSKPSQEHPNTPEQTNDPVIKPIESVTRAKGVTLINETNYNIDLDSIINSLLKIKQGKGPQVLIYHTHTYESFAPSQKYKFTPTDTDRTSDSRYNMIRVGEELGQELRKKYGINIIHDKTVHDGSSYNKAYSKSLQTVQGYIKKYPSLSLIIDMHRDGADINGKKLRVSTSIDGKPVATVMTVIGTDGRGLPHPKWRENLKLGVKFNKKMNDLYPGMGRGVNLKLGRFNQFLSTNAVLLEVGSNGNTLDESIESTKYIARAISEVFKEAR